MHLCGVACYAAVPERTSDFLAPAARGRHSSTLAFSERGSRSHFWAPVSRAVRNDGQVSLSAEKSFVTSAGHADGYVVSTLDAEESTPVASTIYLVLANDPGVSASTPWDGLGLRGNSSGPLSLKDVTIPTERA
jgi:alkylation response protein AidB-like acyl-CoA dehydrogenase